MPNHVRNIVKFIGSDEDVTKVLESIKGLDGENKGKSIDFQRIIPMPTEYLQDDRWYEWRIHNWNTKWNAYDINQEVLFDEPNIITFNTAWSAPTPVLVKLSKMFPSVDIHYVFADEDLGYNTGKGIIRNGYHLKSIRPTGGSDEAMALYFETHPEDEPYIRKVDGEWRWVDDDEEVGLTDEEAFLEAQNNEAETNYFNS